MSTDVLMITHNRPEYTRRSLNALLRSCDNSTRVWVWQNGDHVGTLKTVETFLDHPRLHRFHHSPTNERLRTPTNWLWSQASGDYVGKVDDDCMITDGWLEILRRAHEDNASFGVIGSWHFRKEDFDLDLAAPKIHEFEGGHRLLRNLWLGGSGYLMKRACVDDTGLLRDEEGWTGYCIRLASRGWVNGWYYPLVYQDHMDDPRSPHTMLHTTKDLHQQLPLSASNRRTSTIEAWECQLRESARKVQSASLDHRAFSGIGWKFLTLQRRLKKLMQRWGDR